MIVPAVQFSGIARYARGGDDVGGHVASGLCGGLDDGVRTFKREVGGDSIGLSFSESLPKSRRSSCHLPWLGHLGVSLLPRRPRREECLRCRGSSQRPPYKIRVQRSSYKIRMQKKPPYKIRVLVSLLELLVLSFSVEPPAAFAFYMFFWRISLCRVLFALCAA